MQKNTKLKVLKLVLIISYLVITVLLFKNFKAEDIRRIIEGRGVFGPIIYIALFTILPIFLFPVPLLVLPAGIIFGLKYGVIYTVIAAILNSIIMFYLGRITARKSFEKFIKEKTSAKLRNRLLSENQSVLFSVFFVLRLVPLVSYNFINYVAGLTRIKIIPYIISTVIGILPGTIVFINAGDKSLNPGGKDFKVSLILLIGLTLISVILLKVYLGKKGDSSDEENFNNNSPL